MKLVALVVALTGIPIAGAQATHGTAIVGGEKITVRSAAVFSFRADSDQAKARYAFGIALSEKQLRCSDVRKLPDQNDVRSPWALVVLAATKDGFPDIGTRARGTMDYPVDDAYASISRGVAITLTSAAPYAGGVWTGRVAQGSRRVDGKVYSVRADFAARWCG